MSGMDDKTAKALTKALQDNTRALQEHSKLLTAITGKKAPPRPPVPQVDNRDPLTRLLAGQR